MIHSQWCRLTGGDGGDIPTSTTTNLTPIYSGHPSNLLHVLKLQAAQGVRRLSGPKLPLSVLGLTPQTKVPGPRLTPVPPSLPVHYQKL